MALLKLVFLEGHLVRMLREVGSRDRDRVEPQV